MQPDHPDYSALFPEAYRCQSEGHIPGPDWGCSMNGVADVWCARCDKMLTVPFEQLPKAAQELVLNIFMPVVELPTAEL